MERCLIVVFAVVVGGVACGGKSIGRHEVVDGTGTGGGEGGAGSASGGTSAGGVSATGGLPNTGGSADPCGCAVTLASDQLYPGSIAVDATTVYYTVVETLGTTVGNILKMPLTGGTPETLVSSQPELQAIAVDATSLYWVTAGTIWKAPIAGGPSVQIVAAVTDSGQFAQLQRFALGATNVYWTTAEADDGDSMGAVYKAPIGGGDPVRLATVRGGGPTDLTSDATHVYWVNSYPAIEHAVMKVPIAGGTPTPVAPGGLFESVGIAVDPNGVFWTQFTGNTSSLMHASLGGTAPVELAFRGARAQTLTFDGTDVYWGTLIFPQNNPWDGAIMKTTLGSVTTTITDGINASQIATYGGNVCWTAEYWNGFGGLGSVMCLTKCDATACP